MGFFTTTPEERAKNKATRVRSFLLGMTAGIRRSEKNKLKKEAETKDSDIKEEESVD
jgi:hypothetical protein